METKMLYEENKIEVVFVEKEKLKINDFSNFLYHLKIVYTYVYKNEQMVRDYLPLEYDQWGKAREEIIDVITKDIALPQLGRYDRYNAFKMDLKEDDLYISQIRKESPLIIWFMGVSTVLVLAFIICGGELELSAIPPRIRIKMPSIASGLRQIKELFKKT